MEDSIEMSNVVPHHLFSSSSADLFPLKRFVRESLNIAKPVEEKTTLPVSPVSGLEAKQDYEKIVGSCPSQSMNKSKVNKDIGVEIVQPRRKTRVLYTTLNVNTLMKAAETNDVKTVNEYLRSDENFVKNSKDDYGWTAMMCACCAGSKDVVQLLLKHKPDINVKDKKGNTCLSLARNKGNHSIEQIINNYLSESKKPTTKPPNVRNEKKIEDMLYCETCKENISALNKDSHATSMVHLFNSSRFNPARTAYGIPDSNVGFQILLKRGWDREKGLGPDGDGHKFPPKTILKQDRTGLGAKKYAAKVTHNPIDIKKERIENKRTANKRDRQKKERRDKIKERELRRALD